MTGEPALLLFRGEILADSLRQARVTEGEVRSAIRSAGLESFQEAEAVVLETDASFSVIPRQNDGAGDEMPSLSDVQRHDRSDHR